MFDLVWKLQRSSIMDFPRKLSFSYRSIVSTEPSLQLFYQPYIWWGKLKLNAVGGNPQERVVRPNTELVIDGFQGSANSFATEAFKKNQTRSVELSHHMHSPLQIVKAVKQDIPILVTIRDPIGAVLSLTSRWSHLSVNQGLYSYVRFYSKLEPYADKCVISDFEQTTRNLDRAIEKVNHKYGTNFDLVDVAQANANYKINASHKFFAEEDRVNRKLIKQQKKAEFDLPDNAKLLVRAKDIYQKLAVKK